MEFNELKMIWDSQNQEPLYAMNEAALNYEALAPYHGTTV